MVRSRLLAPGEEVVLDLRPHWSFVAGPSALLSTCVSALLLAAAFGLADIVLLAVAGAVVGAVAWFAARYVRWVTSGLIVTTERLVLRKGLLSRRSEELPLARVASVEVVCSLRQRLAGTGSLVVHATGDRGERRIGDVTRPRRVRDEIERLLDELDERARRSSMITVAEQLERLDALRRRGVINDAEMEAEKRRLLGGSTGPV